MAGRDHDSATDMRGDEERAGHALPAGASEGTWLRDRVAGDGRIDREETERAHQRVNGMMEQLQQRGRGPR
jgi:hypothetical protein